ncbi:D12 class N6 adenine-specific DNA methyltransferase [Paenibacillus sp. FSL R7-269]|uniref:DNA adenine methylase n=1 Tax=Paenibacillus sp. FSL R7-269 TaxID=1226755 RepID=UPI0003E1DF6C|nr:DNA adenine methylase [Paenibacillus sp. FSL R7-269]ETT56796.1 D12 class N6 adenine-specific DNA methyltransferase [Paenibacillus sp. FSL R7-269]
MASSSAQLQRKPKQRPASAISYIGGKYALVGNIIPVIEWCASAYKLDGYLEVCGGGCRMLLNLDESLFKNRSYNDMDIGLCNLFACLGDHDLLYRLIDTLEERGCSEEVFLQAQAAREYASDRLINHGEYPLDQVTSAADVFILAGLSRASCMTIYDQTRVNNLDRRHSYYRKIHRLEQLYSTMEGVEVTHGDCREVLRLHQRHSNYFAYIDPPYVPSAMEGENHYAHSWSAADHRQLVTQLLNTQMKVALSGYDTPLYDPLLEAGWYKLYLKDTPVASSCGGQRKAEFLWINFKLPSSLEDLVCRVDYSQG